MLMRSDSEGRLEFADLGGEGLEPVSQLLDLGADRGDLGGPGRARRPRPPAPPRAAETAARGIVVAARPPRCGEGLADLFQLLGRIEPVRHHDSALLAGRREIDDQAAGRQRLEERLQGGQVGQGLHPADPGPQLALGLRAAEQAARS